MSNIEERVGSETNEGKPSIILSLKERREQVLKEQVLRLPVPRWNNPTIVVLYIPVDHGFIRNSQKRIEKAPKDRQSEVEMEVNSDILIRGCVGVVAVIDGVDYSLRPGDPHGEPTMFDADLAENLGLDGAGGRPPTARAVLRHLFIADGDVLSAASEVIKFSGYREAEADEQILGE